MIPVQPLETTIPYSPNNDPIQSKQWSYAVYTTIHYTSDFVCKVLTLSDIKVLRKSSLSISSFWPCSKLETRSKLHKPVWSRNQLSLNEIWRKKKKHSVPKFSDKKASVKALPVHQTINELCACYNEVCICSGKNFYGKYIVQFDISNATGTLKYNWNLHGRGKVS